MPPARKREDQPWLRYIVLPLILILFGLIISTLFFPNPVIAPSEPVISVTTTPTPTPTPTPPGQDYICPTTPWVDCMPGPDLPPRPQCESDFLRWATSNCPGFEGAAL